MVSTLLLDILNIIGVIACGVTGALAAGRVKMDYFGVLIISFVTGLGGGSIRDVLFSNYPLSWIQDPSLLLIAGVASITTIIVAPFMRYLKTMFLVLDALGMVAFTILGAQVAYSLGYGLTLACVAGVSTGAFGGVLRDLLCNRIPLAFQHELYASISLMTVVVYHFGLKLGYGANATVIVAIIFGLSVRLLAIRYNWSLPVFDYDDDKYLNHSWLDNMPHRRIKSKVQKYLTNHKRQLQAHASVNEVAINAATNAVLEQATQYVSELQQEKLAHDGELVPQGSKMITATAVTPTEPGVMDAAATIVSVTLEVPHNTTDVSQISNVYITETKASDVVASNTTTQSEDIEGDSLSLTGDTVRETNIPQIIDPTAILEYPLSSVVPSLDVVMTATCLDTATSLATTTQNAPATMTTTASTIPDLAQQTPAQATAQIKVPTSSLESRVNHQGVPTSMVMCDSTQTQLVTTTVSHDDNNSDDNASELNKICLDSCQVALDNNFSHDNSKTNNQVDDHTYDQTANSYQVTVQTVMLQTSPDHGLEVVDHSQTTQEFDVTAQTSSIINNRAGYFAVQSFDDHQRPPPKNAGQ